MPTLEEIKAKEYKPGDSVPKSGIYKVTHDSQHAAGHEVTCVFGEHFPPCNHCGHHPRFRLVQAAQHVETHDHFKRK